MNWKYQVHVGDLFAAFEEGKASFEETRNGVVERLRDTGIEDDSSFDDVVDGITFADDVDEFDRALDDLYDWADDNALWFQTF